MYKLIGYTSDCHYLADQFRSSYIQAALLARNYERNGCTVYLSCGKRTVRFY